MRTSARAVAWLVVVCCLWSASAFAADPQLGGGVMRRNGLGKSIIRNDVSIGSYTVNFPTVAVGGRWVEECYYMCFIAPNTPASACGNAGGTVALTKGAGAPFSVINLRVTAAGSCNGTPVTLPVTLSAGQWIVQDFVFSPTTAGTFSDTHINNLGGGDFTWFLNGATPAAPLTILSFSATPATVTAGRDVTLSWNVQGASSVTIDNGLGSRPSTGTVTVRPSTTTTYTLTAFQGSSMSTASVTVTVLTAPAVSVTSVPAPLLQQAGSGGATTTYALTNSGSSSTSITLSQDKTFFTQSPTAFTLAAGATQIITVQGTAQAAGAYEGVVTASGNGVPSGLQIPVKLLSAAPPSGSVTAAPPSPRVDFAFPVGSTPTGSVSFTNTGAVTLTGILSSDAPWIVPQSGPVTIAPGATGTFNVTIDRSKRPDSAAPIGSLDGNVILSFFTSITTAFAAKGPLDTTTVIPSVSLVKVIDTATPVVTSAGVPALAANEVALFVAGAGHVTGTGGTQFISDINVLNPLSSRAIDDVKMYYTAATATNSASSKTLSLPAVPGQVSVTLANVVKNVFGSPNEVGTVQIRSKDTDKLAVSATVLTPNNPAGVFGNTIPILRSDRSIAAASTLVLTGLRKDNSTHTNIYYQETAGAAATVRTDFFAADGSLISTRNDSVDAFKLLQSVNVVPANAVAAAVTNTSTAGGKISAYATPVDEASTDTWAIADWSLQYGYSPTSTVVVPVAGSVHGANNTFYRTDLAISNRGTAQSTGTLRYVTRTGQKIDRTVTLSPRQTVIYNDVIGSQMNVAGDSTGYLLFTPTTGGLFAVSSRTFTTSGTSTATFGAGVPALATSQSLGVGDVRPIAGLADATRTTVVNRTPGTFRTNFAVAETSGNPVVVRVTFRFTFPAGQKAQGLGIASRDYALSGNQFMLLNSIAGEILGAARLQYADLTNVEADFQVVSGTGRVAVFTSSVDNSTGDSILRTD